MSITQDPIRSKIWIVAIVTFVVWDIVTTAMGAYTPGVYETNPLFEQYFNNQQFAHMLIIKLSITSFIFAIDVFWYRLEGFGEIPFIPVLLIWYGTRVTISNMEIVVSNGFPEIPAWLLLGITGYITYGIVKLPGGKS